MIPLLILTWLLGFFIVHPEYRPDWMVKGYDKPPDEFMEGEIAMKVKAPK